MAQKSLDKFIARKQLIRLRTEALFGLNEDAQDTILSQPTLRCIRYNPLVAPIEETRAALIDAGVIFIDNMELPSYCDVLSSTQSELALVTLQTGVTNGSVFYQNPSSILPVIALDPQPGDNLLDLCASPGGKASLIAALTNNQAHLTLNDTSFDRLQRLKRVCQLLQVKPAEYTMVKGEAASKKFTLESFDKIILDAPCSGEDIRMIASESVDHWSPAKVKRLAELQKKLIKEAWKLVKPGGTLVYSTCSQAPEEDEAVISWFLSKHEDATTLLIDLPYCAPALKQWTGPQFYPGTERAVRVMPGITHISFFACAIQKLA
jgi:16S rRNA (cytosine1407-C5)-methyltransferase